MPRIKINKGDKGFTTMFNTHFMDKRLSWGAVGMLSNVMSLPDDWEFSVKGFEAMHSGGNRAVTSLIYELEWFGYLERIQIRDTKGKFVDYIYEFFNESQLPEKTEPVPAWKDRKQFAFKRVQIIDVETGEVVSNSIIEAEKSQEQNPQLQNAVTDKNAEQNPQLQNAVTDNAVTEIADTAFVEQLNTNKLNTNNINYVSNQSINHIEDEPKVLPTQPKEKKIDRLNTRIIDRDTINDIKDQIDYEFLLKEHDRDLLDTAVSCIADLYTASEPQTFNGRTYSADLVHRRSLEIDSGHLEYVFECFKEQREKVKNIRKYMLTAIFNAPDTSGAYYENAVRAIGMI